MQDDVTPYTYWGALVNLAIVLRSMLSQAVDYMIAQRLVRLVMAECVRNAMIGAGTFEGVYLEALLVALDVLNRHYLSQDLAIPAEPTFKVYRPSAMETRQWAQLYAITYEAVYLANLSRAEVAHLIMCLKCYDIQLHDEATVNGWMSGDSREAVIVRRAFKIFKEHDHGKLPVCRVAHDLKISEYELGQAWLLHTSEEEVM